jgi:phage-related minor tail protein
MKKFCSTCGNQLELSQRFCGGCGAVNPFFVPAFTLLAEQKESLEKLRIEKERIEAEKARIEKELAEIELAQREVERQEQLRREVEELDRQKAERIEQERLLREQAEREKIEANLKKEILRVKEEAEQYKNETIDLVRKVRREVKEEINHIEEENKKLKQEVQLLSQQIPERIEQATTHTIQPPVVNFTPTPPVVNDEPVSEQPAVTNTGYEAYESSNGFVKIALAATVLLLIGLGVFYFYMRGDSTGKEIVANTEPHSNTAVISGNKVVDTVLSDETPAAKDTTPVTAEQLSVAPAVLTTTTKPATVKNTTASSSNTEKPANSNVLTVAKVRHDLTGRKISGCGITIGSEDELEQISNIVLVEKTGKYTRYKCEVQITQGSDSYIAHPYLYYNTDGSFMKLDGTSCE